jgi:hypothetical protein
VKSVEKMKFVAMSLLSILLLAVATPLMSMMPVSAEETDTPATLTTDGNWNYIQNDMITIVFPAGGKKPMFLWWYTNDPDNINVVRFKGLVEYDTFEKPYFMWKAMAESWRIREYVQNHYYGPKQHMFQNLQRLKALEKLWEIGNATGLHAPYLPFNSAQWRLDGPVNVTRDDVKYLSFNFTLVDVPGSGPHFQFAEGNIILRCRFYYTPATEDAHGQYTYDVNAGELKIDIVIKKWEWNIDKLEPILEGLRDLGFDIPEHNASLALWVNLASINMTKLEVAEKDTESMTDADMTESVSNAKVMYVEDAKISVVQNDTANDTVQMQNRWRERFQLRFEKGNATFAGFFNFVPQAIVTDGTTYNTTDVTAAYVEAGAHLQLFIGYPYFGAYTLEHDPSLGLEGVSSWLSTNLLLVLIGATVIIAVAVAAIKLRRKVVNIVAVQ